MSITSTDPISDMFTRIRNAIAVNKTDVAMPHSRVKETVARILVTNGFLKGVSVDGEGIHKLLHIVINDEQSNATITEISRLSKPGRRVYVSADEIPKVKRGRGIIIISTSSGVMTGREASSKHLGGELIGQVY
jgi:small subunit ribosomal protein S8